MITLGVLTAGHVKKAPRTPELCRSCIHLADKEWSRIKYSGKIILEMSMDGDNDNRERRCPRLGGPVSFRYCRQEGENDLPCWKVIDCWWESFEIGAYLRRNLSEDQFRRLATFRPKPKVSSLIEMIEQAKKRCGS
jgi:hypothetical protein